MVEATGWWQAFLMRAIRPVLEAAGVTPDGGVGVEFCRRSDWADSD
jgi:hypothetical protein